MNSSYLDLINEDNEVLDLSGAFEDPDILEILKEVWNEKMLWTNPTGVLLFIYLHQRKEVRFIKIKDDVTKLFKHTYLLAYKELGKVLSNNDTLPWEEEDFKQGIKAYAFVADVRQDNHLCNIIPGICIDDETSPSIPLSFDTLYFLYELMNENRKYKVFIEDYPPQAFAERIIEWSKDTKIDSFYSLESSFLRKGLTCIISRLISPKNKAVLHPWAGPGSYIPSLHKETNYTPIYQSKDDATFGKVVAEMYCPRKYDIYHEGDTYKLQELVLTLLQRDTVDCVLVDDMNMPAECLWSIMVETAKHNSSGVFLVKTEHLITEYQPGMCFPEFASDLYTIRIGDYDIEKYISHIFYLPNGLSILLAPKEKKDTGNIVFVNETNNCFFNPKTFFEHINKKDREIWHIASLEKVHEQDCRFNLNEFLTRNEREKIAKESGSIALGKFLISDNLSRLENEPRFVFDDIFCNDYSKFLPYYEIDNKGNLTRKPKEEVETGLLYLIVDLRNEKLFQPKIMAITPYIGEFGQLCALRMGIDIVFKEGIVAYRIDGEQIDCNFLISEMNKDYFIKQIFKVKKEDTNYEGLMNRIDTFEECSIIIPDNLDSTTPLKRQRHYYNEEKLQFLKILLDSFDYNLENINSHKNPSLPIDSLIKENRYRIVDNLGAGGYGIVYKAIDQANGKYVAIKEFFDKGKQLRAKRDNNVFTPISNDLEEIMEARKMFMAEAIKIMGFSNNNIIKINDVFDDNETCYYSMEYINGCNLEEYVRSKGALEETLAVRIIKEVCYALREMHNHKMCHYDISPENIMIDRENSRILLVDFGSAKTSSDSNNIIYTKRMYSPASFEKLNTNRRFHPQWDIYSLGVTLYFMLNGEINEHECSQNNNNISGTIDFKKPTGTSDKTWNCIVKAIRISYKERQQSVDEFLAMLPCE